jgi:hypothetical protein
MVGNPLLTSRNIAEGVMFVLYLRSTYQKGLLYHRGNNLAQGVAVWVMHADSILYLLSVIIVEYSTVQSSCMK